MRVLRHPPARAARPVALTIGNFDGVHLGHQAMISTLLSAARERGVVSCVMTFEPHPREFFAPDQAPTRLTSLREKLELLAGLGVEQTLVCRFDYDFARIPADDFIQRILVASLGVRWVLVGDDFRFGARRLGDFDLLAAAGRAAGFEVERMASYSIGGVRASSTAVRERLAAGDLDGAAVLLGRPYSISGRVVGGNKLGAVIGFPTANVQLQHNRPPVMGIFAVDVVGLDPRPLRGAASLGVRPTVSEAGVPVLEVHLFDFDRDIYRRRVQVRFLKKLRDERKYPDLAALTAAIARDVADAKTYFRHREHTDHRDESRVQCAGPTSTPKS
jgi:riboflavin kinase/FMN adenylyltransferase